MKGLWLIVNISSVLLLGLGVFINQAKAFGGDKQFMFCEVDDGMNKVAYFSDVFATSDFRVKVENAFTNHVHGNYDNVIGTAQCFEPISENTQSAARSLRDQFKTNARRVSHRIVDTSWAY